MKKLHLMILGAVLISGIVWLGGALYIDNKCSKQSCNMVTSPPPFPTVLSFNDCAKAGLLIMESYPRQCRTPDGRTFVEELPSTKPTYINATSGVISVTTPTPDSVTGKEFEVRGVARGWYFEGSFPVVVIDKDSKVLATTPAQAQSDWMTSEEVSFIAKIKIPTNYIGKATIILKKDNPSGLPKNDASMAFPITIEY